MKLYLPFVLLSLIAIIPANTYAVIRSSEKLSAERIQMEDQVQFLDLVNSNSNRTIKEKLGRKLSFKEKVGSLVIQKMVKKVKKKNNREVQNVSDEPETDPLAIIGLVCLFVFPMLSIVLGIISLNRIKNHPDKYKGKVMARISLWGGIIMFLLSLILFAIYISYLFFP